MLCTTYLSIYSMHIFPVLLLVSPFKTVQCKQKYSRSFYHLSPMPSLIYLLLKLRYLDCKTISKPSGIKEDRTYTQKQQAQITPHKRSQDPQIPPPIPKVQSKALIELITDLIRTVLTSTRRIIHNIPIPSPLEETSHVLPTSLSR
jgi:hypothetical protein